MSKKAPPTKQQGQSLIRNSKAMYALLGALLLSLIAFWPSLSNDWTNWDDPYYVLDNELVKNLSADNLIEFLRTPERSLYHPLTMLSLAFNYTLSGDSAYAFHLTNLLLHLLNVFLVFLLFHKLTRGSWIVAGTVALFFGIHPMHVESVAWISERKDVLFALFYFLAGIAYLQRGTKRFGLWFWMSLFFFLLSLLSKPTAVTLPIVLLLFDYWQDRSDWKRAVLEKTPFFALSILFGLITIYFQSIQAIGDWEQFSLSQRFLFAIYGAGVYVYKAVFPYPQSAFYPYPGIADGLPAIFYIAPVLLTALMIFAFLIRKQLSALLWGLVFFFMTIAINLQFVSVGGAITADRYTYIPYLGLFFILGCGLQRLSEGKASTFKIATGATLVFAFLLSALSFSRCMVWKDSKTLWSDVISKYDNVPYAYYNRGIVSHYDDKNAAAALSDYNKAIKLKPDYKDALYNRGILKFYELKQVESAVEDYSAVLKSDPNHANALYARGLAYFYELKKPELALSDFDHCLESNPQLHAAYNNRGSLLFNHFKQYDKALENFNRAIEIHSSDGQYFKNRSFAYYGKGDFPKALKDAKKAQQMGQKFDPAYIQKIKGTASES